MKPILFNTDMVRAILEGNKTATRRVVKPQPTYSPRCGFIWKEAAYGTDLPPTERGAAYNFRCAAPYHPGDILYVRETWQYAYDLDGNEQPIEGTGRYLYAADNLQEPFGFWVNPDGTHRDSMPWRPSIHMPREAARIFLRVTDVQVERLQNITELDILEKEGIEVGFPQPRPTYMSLAYAETRLKPEVRKVFANLWDGTIKRTDRALYGWAANPWVWVVAFERCDGLEDPSP